jgi:hypothetical protein
MKDKSYQLQAKLPAGHRVLFRTKGKKQFRLGRCLDEFEGSTLVEYKVLWFYCQRWLREDNSEVLPVISPTFA